ncbi:aldo/keto reductase [Aquincola tertiaricarbonis]|uniref:Aldo/keto reductase n=1 Tax=Aquincola tertiaricarbonis TaxID=391953 RepID=A0ABY4SFK4_AQUTE|nr:aldo/keto reductase [Aquincola tertiaricarbonis]URI09786.1 aldo/keto reductase [Aquincola tertiaricarbonis]
MTSADHALPAAAPFHLSPIVAGAWRMADWGFSPQQRLGWIEACLALGITSFDHADIYGGYTVEALFGEALAAAPGLRDRMQLVSKCGIKLVSPQRPGHAIKSYDTSRAHVVASVEQSLRALRTDRLDLLLIHRPDLLTDPDELADTFSRLRADGKVLQFGVSNHTPSQLAMLHRRLPLVTNQIELSPLQMGALGDGTLDQCTDLGLRPMIWSPLGGGRLFTSDDAQARRVREVLQALATQHGVSVATVAYAWILRHPSRPLPIAGSSRVEAMREAVAALDLRLPAEDWYRVWQASMGHEVA